MAATAPFWNLGLAVVLCLRCRVCSVCVHPGCPSLAWLRGFGLGIKLGACKPIAWTAGGRMNLERSSVQIVHSFGKFRAVFVKFIQFSSFGWIFRVNFVLICFSQTFYFRFVSFHLHHYTNKVSFFYPCCPASLIISPSTSVYRRPPYVPAKT